MKTVAMTTHIEKPQHPRSVCFVVIYNIYVPHITIYNSTSARLKQYSTFIQLTSDVNMVCWVKQENIFFYLSFKVHTYNHCTTVHRVPRLFICVYVIHIK